MSAYEVVLAVRDAAMVASLVGFTGAVACVAIGWFVTVPTFDRLTNKHQGIVEMISPVGGPWMRLMKYSVAIAWPNYVIRTATGIAMYSEFPYRSHASKAQICLSYCFVTAAVALLVGVFVFGILDIWFVNPEDQLGD